MDENVDDRINILRVEKLKTQCICSAKVDNWVDHPIIRPSINPVKMTYDPAHDPEYADLMTAN